MRVLDKIMSNKTIKANVFVDKPKEYINTGSLVLNILYSGKLDGGIVKGKVMQIVAPSALGKSFVAMKIAKNAQKQGMEVLLVDTEFAYDPIFANKVGINQDMFGVIQTNSMEEIQQSLISAIQDLTQDEKDNLLIVLDSWGNMVTSKTMNDAVEGKDVSDMTISKKKNALARMLSGLKTTVFIVNQTYQCGIKEMMVKTPKGDVSLADLNVGDIVLTSNGYEAVSFKVKYDDAHVSEVELEDGSILSFTQEHRFKVLRNGKIVWVTISDLLAGEDLIEYASDI